MKKLFLLLFVVSLTLCTSDKIVGTTDEQLTVKAMISNPDGTAAVGATVKLFKVDDSLKTPAFTTVTDTDGRYTVSGVSQGTYNIWAEKDTLVAFQDSIVLANTDTRIPDDTIYPAGSLTAIVSVQPTDDPRSVIVQVMGSDRYDDNIQSDGRFTIHGLASGNYRLRLTTTLPNYTTTYCSINAHGGQKDTLKDTIDMIYTGIPVVLGLTASFDTLNGTMNLTWRKTAYLNFQDYVIYRDAYDSIQRTTIPAASVPDTFWIDTIFNWNLPSGQFSFGDTTTYKYKYRVVVRNNSDASGLSYGFATVTAAPPKQVRTLFTTTIRQVPKGLVTDSASINDSVRIKISAANATRPILQMIWKNIDDSTTIKTTAFIDTVRSCQDSLEISWSTIGKKKLACVAVDAAGTEWTYPIVVTIVKDAPVITAADTVQFALTTPGTIKATASDRFGNVVKYEWDVGNTGSFVTTTTAESPAIKIDSLGAGLKVVLRVTDDDEVVTLKTTVVVANLIWEKVSESFLSTPFETIMATQIIDKKICVYSRRSFNYSHKIDSTYLYTSNNGINWQKRNTLIDSANSAALYSIQQFAGKCWGVFRCDTTRLKDFQPMNWPLYQSVDGIIWERTSQHIWVSSYSYIPWVGFFEVFNNKLCFQTIDTVINGDSQNLIVNTSDGISWGGIAGSTQPVMSTVDNYYGAYFEFRDTLRWIGHRRDRSEGNLLYTLSQFPNYSKVNSPFISQLLISQTNENNLLGYFIVFMNKIICIVNQKLFFSGDCVAWQMCSDLNQSGLVIKANDNLDIPKKVVEYDGHLYFINSDGVWATK
jgi:hypothetical protein